MVWSDYDASIDAWRLMEHAGGVTRALPIEPRRTPFDVDLGPDGRGGVRAVYSRCARGLRLDFPTPQNQRAARHGCVDGGPAAEPTAQPGGTFALEADDAVVYRRMPRSWQPMRPPR